MKVTVQTKEVTAAHNALVNIGTLKPKNNAQALRIAQNIRVLVMERRTIETQREVVLKDFPDIKRLTFPDGRQGWKGTPEGWDDKDPASNSDELKKEAADLMEKFQAAMKELDDSELEVDLRGLRINKDLPEGVLPVHLADCYWLIDEFDGEVKEEEPPPSKRKKAE